MHPKPIIQNIFYIKNAIQAEVLSVSNELGS